MSSRQPDAHDPALVAMASDVAEDCAERLARVAGTHALVLDGLPVPAPATTGVARWTILSPDGGVGWRGPLRAAVDALPFADDSFCAVLVRFADCGAPEVVAAELARVLAPHGTLLVADFHPRSLWLAGAVPGVWERALRGSGLEVAPATRCGAPWRRSRGAAGLPRWLVRGAGGAWVIEAHRQVMAAIPLRNSASTRRTVEQAALLPGARRQRA